MTYKQWMAVMGLMVQVIVVVWLVIDAGAVPASEVTAASVAAKLLWAILVMIGLMIVGAIVTAIVGSIVTREEFKDERADERDKAISAKSGRNAYFATSVGGIGTMLLFAFGFDPALIVYTVFGVAMVGGTVESLSQLYYYRFG